MSEITEETKYTEEYKMFWKHQNLYLSEFTNLLFAFRRAENFDELSEANTKIQNWIKNNYNEK